MKKLLICLTKFIVLDQIAFVSQKSEPNWRTNLIFLNKNMNQKS